MKISHIHAALEAAHKANLSVFLKGAPGTGKTAIVREYADAKGMKLLPIHAPLVDLLDLKGALSVNDDDAKFLPLAMWPKETDDPVVVLIDEFPQCVPAIQNGFSQMLIDHQMGEITLPKGSLVIATGNRREDKSATHNMPSHIVNRVVHIEIDKYNEDFFTWAAGNGINPEIIAFGRFKPECVYNFDPKNNQDPYATYRSWEQASKLLDSRPPDEILAELIAGVVGKGAAFEFMAFRRLYKDLPNAKDILASPQLVPIPQDPATLYAISTAVAHAANKENVENLFVFASRLPTEFAVLLVKSARIVYKDVTKAKGFGVFALANKSILLD